MGTDPIFLIWPSTEWREPRFTAMPRAARVVVPGMAMHVRQRGHNRDLCFFGAGDYALYLRLLAYFRVSTRARYTRTA